MSDALRKKCVKMLKEATKDSNAPLYRKLYEHVRLDGKALASLQLVWETTDQITPIAFCWSADELNKTYADFRYFATFLSQEEVRKKLHLILFYEPSLSLRGLVWPVGLSFSPIALPKQERNAPTLPAHIEAKFLAAMGLLNRQHTTAETERGNRRHFIKSNMLSEKVREVAEKESLPDAMEEYINRLLGKVETPEDNIAGAIREALDACWEGRR